MLVLALFCASTGVFAQSPDSTRANVRGVVSTSGEYKYRIRYVNLRLITGKDTLKTASDESGFFRFPDAPAGKARLLATHLSMHPTLMEVELFPGENLLEVTMEEKTAEWLKGAKVVAESEVMTHRGDTLVFHASAVNTMEGDYAIDLLSQMPGVEIKDGHIFVEGRPIQRTYVNGKLLFGDVPESALTHLLAEDVSTIEVYDERTIDDMRKGIKVGQKEKVMDIKTKKPLEMAWDAHAIASAGADGAQDENGRPQLRYGAGATVNFFSENFLAYFNANANNIGRNSNRVSDILRVSPLRTYTETALGDIGVEKHWNDRLLGSNIHASYGLRRVYTRDRDYTLTHYFDLPGSPGRTSQDSLVKADLTWEHKILMYGNLATEKAGLFKVSGSVRVESKDAWTMQRTENELSGGTRLRQFESGTDGDRNWSAEPTIDWTKTIGGKWNLRAMVLGNAGHSNGLTTVVDTLETSSNKRYIRWQGAGDYYGVNASLGAGGIFINTDTQSLQVNFHVGYSFSGDRRSREAVSLYPRPGGPLKGGSYDLTYSRSAYSLGTEISYGRGDFRARGSVQLSLENLSPQGATSRRYFVAQGQTTAMYRSWMLTLSASPTIPDASQVADRIDDRNPVNLIAGNPALRPSTRLAGILSYRNSTLVKNATLMASLDGSLKTAPIVPDVRYYGAETVASEYGGYLIPAGTMLSTWSNAPTSWHIALMGSYMQRIQPIHLTILLQPTVGYDRFYSLVGSLPVATSQMTLSLRGTRVSWTPKKWFTLSLLESWGVDLYRGETARSGYAFKNSLGVNSRVAFLKYWNASVSYTHSFNKTSVMTNYSLSTHVLNASLGVKLLGGRLGISISGTDLLGVNDSYSSTFSSVAQTERWRSSFGRYFMLHLSWTFNKTSPIRYAGSLFEGGDEHVLNVRPAE